MRVTRPTRPSLFPLMYLSFGLQAQGSRLLHTNVKRCSSRLSPLLVPPFLPGTCLDAPCSTAKCHHHDAEAFWTSHPGWFAAVVEEVMCMIAGSKSRLGRG
jgi:hypothetical protein